MFDGVRLRQAATPAAVLAAALLVVACGPEAGGTGRTEPEQVTLVTDESWELPDTLRAAFERQADLELVHRKVGATPQELVEKLAETKGEDLGDVVVGIDTATADGALASGALVPYTSPEANKGQQRFSVDRQQRLSAVDRLTVCVNVDEAWFAERDEPPPAQAEELTSSRYARQLAVPSPETSAEGTGFLLGSVAREGSTRWRTFWAKLKAGDVQVLPTMDDVVQAYTAGSEEGERPLVVGPATLPDVLSEQDGDGETSVLPDTCHEQVRYAGMLAGADNTQRAGKLLDFLLKQEFQQAVPETFGTYPARDGVEPPDGWAAEPEEPTTLSARTADTGRNEWISRWRKAMR